MRSHSSIIACLLMLAQQARVEGAEHLAHAALSDRTADLVVQDDPLGFGLRGPRGRGGYSSQCGLDFRR